MLLDQGIIEMNLADRDRFRDLDGRFVPVYDATQRVLHADADLRGAGRVDRGAVDPKQPCVQKLGKDAGNQIPYKSGGEAATALQRRVSHRS